MPADAEVLVTCTHGACSLKVRLPPLDLATLILLYPENGIPGYDAAQADKRAVPCPACTRAGRDGILIYLDDHLKKAPPDMQVLVPLVFDATVSLWKRAFERLTVTGQKQDYQPEKTGPAVAHRLSVRPYDGYVLRPGNDDLQPQYGDSKPGVKTKILHVRKLKRDLLYLAYYGTRERLIAKDLGGVHVFEASLVGPLLALKFDLSFFYGVPTTTDLSQTMVSDAELRQTTLETFSKPIYFDPNLADNPVKPIANALIYPLGERLHALAEARASYEQGLALFAESKAADLPAKKVRALRQKALAALKAGKKKLPEEVLPLDLAGVKNLKGERRSRSTADVVAHPEFEQCRREPWDEFARDLSLIVAMDPASEAARVARLEQMLTDLEDDPKLKAQFQARVDRYKLHADAVAQATQEQLEEVKKIVGGLPETFATYRAEMHRYAVVDHATAFYILAMLSEVRIGSNSGKLTAQPGRKLVYHMPLTIENEPKDLDAYADLVIEACKNDGKFDTPPFIMLERQKNESGYRATDLVRELATSEDEKSRRVPMVGIDWSNWGRKSGAVTKFAFSELFTNSVGRRQDEYPGYFGPIVHSRGVGGGQVTAPTLVEGVSPDVRQRVEGYEWVSGIPAPNGDTMPTPGNWMGAKGSIRRSLDLLNTKFRAGRPGKRESRDCTYGKVAGGKKYECAKCLARFRLDDAWLLAAYPGAVVSYYCTAEASRWQELFGEPLAEDTVNGRAEYPCSWLRAVQLYAGGGDRADRRLFLCASEIVAVGKAAAGETGADDEGEPDEEEDAPQKDPPEQDKKKQGKKKKKRKKTPPQIAIEAAFARVRKEI